MGCPRTASVGPVADHEARSVRVKTGSGEFTAEWAAAGGHRSGFDLVEPRRHRAHGDDLFEGNVLQTHFDASRYNARCVGHQSVRLPLCPRCLCGEESSSAGFKPGRKPSQPAGIRRLPRPAGQGEACRSWVASNSSTKPAKSRAFGSSLRGGVVVGEVAAAPAEHFAHRRGGEVGDRGRHVVAARSSANNLLRGAKDALVEGVDEERRRPPGNSPTTKWPGRPTGSRASPMRWATSR